MYRRPKFLEKLIEIRCEMALEADYDVELFAEIVRSGNRASVPRQRPAERMIGPAVKDADMPQPDKIVR